MKEAAVCLGLLYRVEGVERQKNVNDFEECAHLRIPCMAQEMHKITGYNFVAILPPLPKNRLLYTVLYTHITYIAPR